MTPRSTHFTFSASPDPSVEQSNILFLDRPSSSPSTSPSNSLSRFLTKSPSDYSSRGGIQKFRPKLHPDFPAGVHLKLSNQSPLPIPQPGSISNFQPKILPHRPARVYLKTFPGYLHIPSRAHIQLPPKKNYIVIPQLHAFSKLTPEEPPSTRPT